MKSGIIKLYYKGQVQKEIIYNSVEYRKMIVETWRKLYGMKFEECWLQIVPYERKRVYRQLEAA